MSRATITYTRLQVYAPPNTAGTFVIGANRVGDALTAAGISMIWDDITADLTRLSVVRGGAADRVLTSMDVGILTATFLNLPDGPLAPGRKVRLVTTDDDTKLFSGRVFDIKEDQRRPTPSSPLGDVFTTVTVVDPVQTAANTTVKGAIAPAGWETFADRIARLLAGAGLEGEVV